jgi:hypothetical protein
MTEAMAAPHWLALGLVIDQNTKDLLAHRYGLLQEVVSWCKAIALFHDAENERLVLQEPTAADLRCHKTWLATLIAEGERLVTEIRGNAGLAENPAGIKAGDVEAALEELYITHREWHGQIAACRKAELWAGVFHVQEPGA